MQGRRDIPLSDRGRAEVEAWRTRWTQRGLRRPRIRSRAVVLEPVAARCRDRGDPVRCPAAVRARADRDGLGRLGRLSPRRIAPSAMARRSRATKRPGWISGRRAARARATCATASCAGSAPMRAGMNPSIAVTHKGVMRAVLAAATGWDMTGKPPLRLQGGALHRFEVDADGPDRRPRMQRSLFADATRAGCPLRTCPTSSAAPWSRSPSPAAPRTRGAGCRARSSRSVRENTRSQRSGGAPAAGSGTRPGRSGT